MRRRYKKCLLKLTREAAPALRSTNSRFVRVMWCEGALLRPNDSVLRKCILEPASLTNDKFQLYDRYQQDIHHDEPGENTERSFCRFLVESPLVASVCKWFD